MTTVETIDMVVVELSLEIIHVSDSHLRRFYDEEAMHDLTESIRSHGVREPIRVYPDGNGEYLLGEGSRRLRAAKNAGLVTIPSIVSEPVSESDRIIFSLTENMQRESLTPFEEAWGIMQLLQEHDMALGEIAQAINKSLGFVRNRLKLLSMPAEVQELLAHKKLGLGHINVLTHLTRAADQVSFAETAISHDLNEDDLATLIQQERGTGNKDVRDVPSSGSAPVPMSGKKAALRIVQTTSLISNIASSIEEMEPAERAELRTALQDLIDSIQEILGMLRNNQIPEEV